MRSLVEHFVAMYASREGEDWEPVRDLCAEYDSEMDKIRRRQAFPLPAPPPNGRFEFYHAARYLRARMFRDGLMNDREHNIDLLLKDLGLYQNRDLSITQTELDSAYEGARNAMQAMQLRRPLSPYVEDVSFGEAEEAGEAGEAKRAMRLGELLSDSSTHALFVHPVVTKSGYTRERTSMRDAVPHRTMRSMVEGYVDMYSSRKGREWKQVRKLCAGYVAEKKRSAI